MELKEFLLIFRRDWRWFWSVAAGFALVGLLVMLFRPVAYLAIVDLNVTRDRIQDTTDYRYDSFYRLQADERFADTVVEWLKSPRLAQEILNRAGVNTTGLSAKQLASSFKPQRRSSQAIRIEFQSESQPAAQKIAVAMQTIANEQTAKLNESQKDPAWFRLVADDPVIRLNKPDWPVAATILGLLGIFFAFWTILIRHYWKHAAV